MSDLATVYERNAQFSQSFDQGDLAIKPNLATIVLTCVDARVDPAYFAGLELGDALVMRTVGGRATDTAILEVAVLWQLMKFALIGLWLVVATTTTAVWPSLRFPRWRRRSARCSAAAR